MIRFENMPPEVMQAMCTPMHQILPSSAIPGPIALTSTRSSSSPSTHYSGRLYLGSLSALSDRSVLVAAGITHLVQVIDAPWLPLTEKDGFICHRIDILDLPEEDLGRFLYNACEWIDKALREGKGVLVHCQQVLVPI
jgi:protein-tyrosine phosphatase